MTTVGPATLPNQVAPRTTAPPHFVEWSAVFAGAVLALWLVRERDIERKLRGGTRGG